MRFVFRLFVGILFTLPLAGQAQQWTLLDGFDDKVYHVSAPPADRVDLNTSPSKTGGAGALEILYTYQAAGLWEKDIVLEKPLPSTVDMRKMEYVSLDINVIEPNPCLSLIIHLVDSEGAEAHCGDYDILKKPTGGWKTKYYRFNDFRKTQWTSKGRAINLSRIVKITYHIKNEKPIPAAGVFRLMLDNAQFYTGGGLLNETLIANFETYSTDAALALRWAVNSPDVTVLADTSYPFNGARALAMKLTLRAPGEWRGATYTFDSPKNLSAAKYMKVALFGHPKLAACDAIAQIVLTDSKGAQAAGTIRIWPSRAEWAAMSLPFEAEGIEGFVGEAPRALQYGDASCWQEIYDDGRPWNEATDLSKIVKVSLFIAGQIDGAYPVSDVTVRFDDLLFGGVARNYTPPPPTPAPSPTFAPAGASTAALPSSPFLAAPALAPAASPTATPAQAQAVWTAMSQPLLQAALAQRRPVVLYFRAGVKTCEDFESRVLLSPEFNMRAGRFTCLFEDISQARVFAGPYRVFRAPEIVILNSAGQIAGRFNHENDPRDLLRALESTN